MAGDECLFELEHLAAREVGARAPTLRGGGAVAAAQFAQRLLVGLLLVTFWARHRPIVGPRVLGDRARLCCGVTAGARRRRRACIVAGVRLEERGPRVGEEGVAELVSAHERRAARVLQWWERARIVVRGGGSGGGGEREALAGGEQQLAQRGGIGWSVCASGRGKEPIEQRAQSN